MKKVSFYLLTNVAVALLFVVNCFAGGPPISEAPEPATWLLMGVGGAGLAAYRRIKRGGKK